jgi:hydroxymethylglutaryl-CoA reductase (NADPH)
MDLRNLPEQLSSIQRINQRRSLIEQECNVDLKNLEPSATVIGDAENKNCEQMFGVVSVPVGYAGPLRVTFSGGQSQEIHLPLATTEGALVASVNRGCKAVSDAGVIITESIDRGITRSIAFRAASSTAVQNLVDALRTRETEWKAVAQATSSHLKILGYDIDLQKQYVFLTVAADTDEAMGMNMVTIAAQAIADWATEQVKDVRCITIAGNVDSDKKPSKRTHDRGRGYDVTASVTLSAAVIDDVLKTTPAAMLGVAKAKLETGSVLAGAIGKNLHVANIIAALFVATGQDIAHTVEGSLADTSVEEVPSGLKVSVHIPAILVGVRGGGTVLPAQAQCLGMLLKMKTGLKPKQQLAETIAAAVLAGEVSLLAAQASHSLASAHKTLAR